MIIHAIEHLISTGSVVIMSGMYRSRPMKYCSILMPHEVAAQAVRVIGEHGCFHVVDLGDKLQPSKDAMTAKKRLQDCGHWERKLQSFEDQMKEFGVDVPLIEGGDMRAQGDVLEAVEAFISPIESELVMNVQFQRENKRLICAAIEHQHVLRVCRDLELQDRVQDMYQPPILGGGSDEEKDESKCTSAQYIRHQ